jgi:ABC-type polysaccharide/polyol phosphate transport system ATPase subunit
VTKHPAISLEDVTLWRRTQQEMTYDLKRTLFQIVERRYQPPQKRRVLSDVTLSIDQGEKIGIIGPNGAGKSTLLKIICGILEPTTGSVDVRGSIAPLIELGAGFDFDLTVRENVVFYGVLLGFSAAHMRTRVDAILEFAELRPYSEEPLKTLSSGMGARLGFAIATDVRPEILIVDEVLAVGDEHFRHKSSARIESFWQKHVTIILVSHDLQFISEACDRVVLMENGEITAVGPSGPIVAAYLELVHKQETGLAQAQ